MRDRERETRDEREENGSGGVEGSDLSGVGGRFPARLEASKRRRPQGRSQVSEIFLALCLLFLYFRFKGVLEGFPGLPPPAATTG